MDIAGSAPGFAITGHVTFLELNEMNERKRAEFLGLHDAQGMR